MDAAIVEDHVPPLQFVHDEEPKLDQTPALQLRHCDANELPIDEDHVPALQRVH